MHFRVPMMVRGPGVKEGEVVEVGNVVNIDIAPTFLDIAGLAVPDWMDGQSFLPLMQVRNLNRSNRFTQKLTLDGRFTKRKTP